MPAASRRAAHARGSTAAAPRAPHRRDDLRDGRIRMVAAGRDRSGSARSGRDPAGSSSAARPPRRAARSARLPAPCARPRARCPQGRAGSARGDSCARRSARRARRRRFPSGRRRPAAANRLSPCKRRLVVDGAQRAGGDLDIERRARIPAPERPGRERRRRAPDQCGQVEDAIGREARAVAGAPDRRRRPARDRPRPRRIAGRRDRRSASRQIEHDRLRLARHRRRTLRRTRDRRSPAARTRRAPPRACVTLRVGPSAMRTMRCSFAPASVGTRDHVARLELDAPGRQLELGASRARPTDPAARYRRGAAPRRGG